MALYSLDHSHIAMHKPNIKGKAAAHLIYTIHSRTTVAVLEARTGLTTYGRPDIREFCASRESKAGKNGRIVEKLIVALPLEATRAQQIALMQALADHITKGEAPYVAALHAAGRAENNPHAHIDAFDEPRPLAPGKTGRPPKVIGLSRRGALEQLRADWSAIHNRMMAKWGYGPDSMIDHRSYIERGIDRLPTIHEGPKARAMAAKGISPTSNDHTGPGGRAWIEIDEGVSRIETNQLIRQLNALCDEQQGTKHESGPHGIFHTAPSRYSINPGSNRDSADGYGRNLQQNQNHPWGFSGGRKIADSDLVPTIRGGDATEPVSSTAIASAEAGTPASLVSDWSINQSGRYRPTALRRLIAKAEQAAMTISRSITSMLGNVDWGRLSGRKPSQPWQTGPTTSRPVTTVRPYSRDGPGL